MNPHPSPKGSANPKACKPGTFQSNMSATSEVDCLPCGKGYYCVEASEAQTQVRFHPDSNVVEASIPLLTSILSTLEQTV